MKTTKCLVLAAVLVAGIGTARADVLTYSAPVSGANGEAMFMLPGFNPARGVLDGVSVVIDGTMGAEISGGSNSLNPTPTVEPIYFQPTMTLNGIPSPNVQASGNATGFYAPYADTYRTPGFTVSATIGQKPDFFTGGAALMDLLYGAWVHDAQTGAIREVTGSADWVLDGTATAYFVYTAAPADHADHPVPEPDSLALLGTGLGLLAFAIRRRRG